MELCLYLRFWADGAFSGQDEHRINPAVEAAQKLLFHPTGWKGASEWQVYLLQKCAVARIAMQVLQ
jgi:hypothetical protein